MGSVVEAHGLSGMWDLSRTEIKPITLNWQVDSQPLDHQRSPSGSGLFFFFFLAVFLTSSPDDFDACQSLRTMSLRNYVGMDQGDWWGGREQVVVPARGEEAENICKGR